MSKTKKVLMDIEGEELVRRIRQVVMEIPEDMSNEEAECVNADHFNNVEERTEWEVNDSSEIRAEGFPTFRELADTDAEPDLIVYRDDSGEYRVRPNEKFLLS